MSMLEGLHTAADGKSRTVPLSCDAQGRLVLAPGAISLGNVNFPAPQVTVNPTPVTVNPPQVNVQPTLPPMLVLEQAVGALAANTVRNSDVLDLGESPRHSLIVARKSGVASNNEQLDIFTTNDSNHANAPAAWQLCPNAAGHNVLASVRYATGQAVLMQQARPMGRYVRATYRSGATAHTAQNPLTLTLVALAGC